MTGAPFPAVTLSLLIAAAAAAQDNLTWNTSSGSWDTTTANWTGDDTIFANGDNVSFNNPSGGTITVTQGMSPTSTTVDSTGSYKFITGVSGTGEANSIASGTLIKGGSGTLQLGDDVLDQFASNIYSNGFSSVTVNGGKLLYGSRNALGTGILTLGDAVEIRKFGQEGNSASFALLNDIVLNGAVTAYTDFGVKDQWFSGQISGTGSITVAGSTRSVAFDGDNTFSGGTTLANGTARLFIGHVNALGTGTLTIDKIGTSNNGVESVSNLGAGPGVANDVTISTGATFNVGGSGSNALLLSGVISGADGVLNKIRNNTVTLAGVNTYGGGTIVDNGTLTIDGSIADSSITINGGTVNGTGTLGFNVDGATADQIAVNGGTLDISGLSVAVNATGSGLTLPEYILVDATGTGYSGTFAGLSGSGGYTLDYGTADQVKLVQGGGVDPGPVDPGNSTVVASPATVAANGIATSTITVTLRDSSGLLIPDEGVTLTGLPANATISPAGAQLTDSSGSADFTVSSMTTGIVDFAATSVTDSVLVSQTASVEFTDPDGPLAFNVNFHAGSDAGGLLGVVGDPGETWNQGTTSVSNLVDTTGTVVSSAAVSGLPSSGSTTSANLNVFDANRNFFGKGADTTLSITGLVPDTAYDLYIYALSHNTSSWGDITSTERAAGDFITSNTVNGNSPSQFLDNGIPGTGGSAFVPNANYVAFESILSDGSGNISVLVDAYDGADGISGNGDGDTRLHINGLQIRPASGMSIDYMAWRDTDYPGLGLPGEDDDGDGFSNDYERIFGMDPTDPGSSSPYSAPFDPAAGSFGYSRRSQSLANLNYKVWYSTDLNQWFEDNAAVQTTDSVVGDVELMGVSIDPTLLSQPRLFVQVRSTPVTGIDLEPSLVNLWGSGSTITLLFSEPMNPSSAANAANYTVDPDGGGSVGVIGAVLSADGGSVTLNLDSVLGIDAGYTVNIDGVTSSTGQALGTGVSRQFTTWDDDPSGIKVFILAGQSNMVGFGSSEDGASGAGSIGSLRYLATNNNDPAYSYYDFTSLLTNPGDTNSAFATRSDVKVWWKDGGANLGGTVRKGDLGPPFKGSDTSKFGPEYAFGQILGDFYPSNDVLIIKCAWGGRDLAERFRPPSAVADRGGRVGEFYSAIIDNAREVLGNLDTEFPAWSGQGYEIVGFGWHQGFNDRINTAFSAEYKNNLPDLVEDVREVFVKPNLPFVIASTGMDTGPAQAPPYSGYSAVEKAQLWVAGVAQPANVLSTDTRPFARDPADSPVTSGNQGFHWDWNAESLFLVGKSMGDNMVNLLTP